MFPVCLSRRSIFIMLRTAGNIRRSLTRKRSSPCTPLPRCYAAWYGCCYAGSIVTLSVFLVVGRYVEVAPRLIRFYMLWSYLMVEMYLAACWFLELAFPRICRNRCLHLVEERVISDVGKWYLFSCLLWIGAKKEWLMGSLSSVIRFC